MDPVVARKTWRTPEPIHTVVYFAPEVAEEYAAEGLDDPAAGYFAARSAAFGAVPAEVVVATFFNFEPATVRRALELSWATTSPDRMLDARLRAVDRALRRLVPDTLGSPELDEAARLARQAAEAACGHPEGRPLFAAHAALAWPDEPHLVLWHAQTLLREFRGDGHVAALVADGVSPVEALVMHGATGEVPPAALRATRAWPDADWQAGLDRLREAGVITGDDPPLLTPAGEERRQRVEDATDRVSLAAYEPLGEDGCRRLRELTRPWSKAIVAGGLPLGAAQN